jgi:hypothetical protein
MENVTTKTEAKKEEQTDAKPLRLEIKRVRVGVSAGRAKGGGSTSDY